MQTSATGPTEVRRPRAQRGFTLIELLVVITIVAILVGAVVLNLDFRNTASAVRDSARRTGLLMQLAADQAVYTRQQLGIRFAPDSYAFFMLVTDNKGEQSWQPIEDDRLRFDSMDTQLIFEVDISGVPIVLDDLENELAAATEDDPLKPHVMFLSNGEITPDFRVLIEDIDGEYRHEVATGEVQPVVVEALE